MNAMVLGAVGDAILDVVKNLLTIIPKFLYFIVSCVLSVIDLCQLAFRKLAGLETITIVGETDPYLGDSVYKIITDALFSSKYPAIKTIFWSLIILGVFMLVITSIIALLRLEYNPDKEKGNSKSGVVKNFFKAIFSFAIVPVACLVGMFLFNALVGVVNTVTTQPTASQTEISTYYAQWNAVEDSNSGSGVYDEDVLKNKQDSYMAYEIFGLHIPTTTEPFSGLVFKACAYGCNRIRNDENYYKALKDNNALGFLGNFNDANSAGDIIDTGFAINAKLKDTTSLNTSILKSFYPDCNLIVNIGIWQYNNISSLSKYNVNAVYYFYDLWTFNYIIAFIATLTIGKLYFSFVLYLMQRLFEVIGLFVVAPISTSLMPLDGGKSLEAWRGMFISKFILLSIMVGTLNLISPIIAIWQTIKLFNIPFLDYIITTFFLMAAFNAVDSLNRAFTKLFTGDDKNYEAVGKAADAISGNFATGVNATLSAARLAAMPITLPARGIGKAAGFMARAHSASQRDRINNKINQTGKDYSDKTKEFDEQEKTWANQMDANQKELDQVNADQATFNEFTNTTGGFTERTQQNDDAMIKAYRKSHYVGKKNSSQEVMDFQNKVKTDSAFRQQVLDEMYAKDDAKKMDSFYKYDKSLSNAENEARKAQLTTMFHQGQTGIDTRRTSADAKIKAVQAEQTKLKTARQDAFDKKEKEIERLNKKLESNRTKQRIARATGGIVKHTDGEMRRASGNIGNVTSVLPLSDQVKKIMSNNKIK